MQGLTEERSNDKLISSLIATYLKQIDFLNFEMTKEEVGIFLESLVDLVWEELDERNVES